MPDLRELLMRDKVIAQWVWTHEVSTGPYTEHEVWDLLLIRNTYEPRLWCTDGETRRTAFFRGITGAQADSRRETGGKRRTPDLFDTLVNLLADAQEIDEYPTFKAWCEYHSDSEAPAWEQLVTFEALSKQRNELAHWLADGAYDEYVQADQT